MQCGVDVRNYIIYSGETPTQISHATGVPQPTIFRIKTGQVDIMNIRVTTLVHLAQYVYEQQQH